MADFEYERPSKKRRFFVEDPDDRTSSSPRSPSPEPHVEPLQNANANRQPPSSDVQTNGNDEVAAFTTETLEAFVGDKLAPDVVKKLQDLSRGNVERGQPTRRVRTRWD